MHLDTERWLRIDHVLAEALEQPPDERSRFAAAAVPDDPDLLEEVLALLQADAQAGLFLRQTPGPLVADLVSSAWIGRRVGPYRLCEVIGYGGMGTVFRAQRDDGEFRHEVAVKLMRSAGFGTEERLRFHTERQVLARLEHPNIARLYDGGTTADGISYLVMELVDGEPIDRYCDQHGLSITARLDLFRQVCEAVRHAHQRLLVHRDLKPSNILVTAEGTPKLLDFGIAKQLDPSVADAVSTTALERPMSLRYASPEQVLGEPTTTASDVYSLGVLLYELLTGVSPYRLQDGSQGLARAICEQDPVPPKALARPLHGDLDAIVLRALRKRPGERYSSIERLIEDLELHRDRKPVRARQGGLRYRAKKFFLRHWLEASAAALMLVVALTAIGNHFRQTWQVAQERDKAEAALGFLIDAFGQADFSRTGGTVTARQVLDRGAERIERELIGQPLAKASLLHAIGEAQSGIGEWERARPLLEQALEIRRQRLGERHRDTALTRLALGVALRELALLQPAEEMLSRAVTDLEALLGDRHVDFARALREQGRLHAMNDRLEQAGAVYATAFEVLEQELPAAHPDIIRALTYRAELSFERGDLETAQRLHTRALEAVRRTFGEDNPEVANSLGNLAVLALRRGRFAEGEALLHRLVDMLRRTVDEDHPLIHDGLHNLAFAAHRQGHLEDAASRYREAVDVARRRLGSLHPNVAVSLRNLGIVLRDLGDLDAASEAIEESLDISLEVHGEHHRSTGFSLCHLGDLRRRQGDWQVAGELLHRCLETLRELHGESHPVVSMALLGLGRLAMDNGRLNEAEPLLRRSWEIRRGTFGEEHWRTGETAGALGLCLAALGRDSESEDLLLRRNELYQASFDSTNNLRRQAEAELAAFYAERGRSPEATTPQALDEVLKGESR